METPRVGTILWPNTELAMRVTKIEDGTVHCDAADRGITFTLPASVFEHVNLPTNLNK